MTTEQQRQQQTQKVKCFAKHSFVVDALASSHQLNFQAGDVIMVDYKYQSHHGWVWGAIINTNTNSSKKGWCPRSYLKETQCVVQEEEKTTTADNDDDVRDDNNNDGFSGPIMGGDWISSNTTTTKYHREPAAFTNSNNSTTPSDDNNNKPASRKNNYYYPEESSIENFGLITVNNSDAMESKSTEHGGKENKKFQHRMKDVMARRKTRKQTAKKHLVA
mmetsp:Transcript_7218/g.10556  ORF Transcript_7218/g.10556 Transcript_7218/m.10556 type:complete len:219 (+) Transcript_7218:97-753(+)|eukprot:CAMPEP_0194216688 /NCGR_PEP_ID=MMETSP0156-20130528/19506_1 /TAXON_ID=33649 /ORGANISM="Thalassionema nitzschioides, Strain L26-B" /LENGTH=218 /DNA_ID=CAMNT_0038945517 /DNA_START=38 /DNA_END=694 /DNA_ORIENTATION=+